MFWEVLNDDHWRAVRSNITSLEESEDYYAVSNNNGVVLLARRRAPSHGDGREWAKDIGKYEHINQVSMKPELFQKLALL